MPFVNWQAKRPVKPSISDALGRSKIRRTKTDPLASDLSPELPFVPVVPTAEPFRINSGLNQSLFGHPHSNTSTSVLPTTRIRIPSPVQAQEPPLILPTIEATQPLYRVAHLEPAKDDAFNRPQPEHAEPIHVEGDTEKSESFEVEALLNKRERRVGRKIVTEYLVRWLGYGPEYDAWYSLSALDKCDELIKEYEEYHGGKLKKIH